MTLSAPQASVAASIALHALALALVASPFVPRSRDAGARPMKVRFEEPRIPEVVRVSVPERAAPAPRAVARTARVASAPVQAPVRAVEAMPAQRVMSQESGAEAPVASAPTGAGVPAVIARPAVAAVSSTPPGFDAAYLRNPAPAYPLMSKRRGEKGRVMLDVRVLPDGTAEQVKLRASSGHERLDQAAIEAVRHWRFVPARSGDDPVAAWVTVPVTFALDG